MFEDINGCGWLHETHSQHSPFPSLCVQAQNMNVHLHILFVSKSGQGSI